MLAKRLDVLNSQRFAALPPIEMLASGLVAVLVVQAFRAGFHRSLLLLCIETVLLVSLPFIFLFKLSASADIGKISRRKNLVAWCLIQLGAIGFGLLPLLLQCVFRPFGLGDAFEVVGLNMVQCSAWFLVVFSRVPGMLKAAFSMSSAVVLFVCFMTERPEVLTLGFLYAGMSLWWLMGTYWSRVNAKSIDGDSRTLPVHAFSYLTIALALVVIGLVAFAFGPTQKLVSVKGFMPTSGGESWHEEYARSGLGDGNMLTPGDNATTTGAVDSDQFLEVDEPSIYDMMPEKFEGPQKLKKLRMNRAVGIESVAKHVHDVKQSELSGKTFRTVRKPANTIQRKLEDRITDALLFVEGSVPARFAAAIYNEFDGVDWNRVKLHWKHRHHPVIEIQQLDGKPWYVLRNAKRAFLNRYRGHKIKIMRFDSHTVPAPSFMNKWHIYRVDQDRMFFWDEFGLVRMGGECIPSQTVIDVVSHIPNYHRLRSIENLLQVDHPSRWWERIDQWLGVAGKACTSQGVYSPIQEDLNSPFLQLPANETTDRVRKLAQKLTDGIEPGWQQVEAIVSYLRNNFTVDPQNVPAADCTDSVGYFLDQTSGPSYLFATTGVLLLRSLGYESRLTSGFIIQQEDYIREAKQSVVTSENVHIWPEVRLEGWHWIPIEPTPTYPIPYSSDTLLQECWAFLQYLARLLWNHPIVTALSLVFVVLIIRNYRRIVLTVCWLKWRLVWLFYPRRRLSLTRRHVDERFWAAGVPRPGFVPIGNWYSRVDPMSSQEFVNLWNLENFCSNCEVAQDSVNQTCLQLTTQLTYQRIKKFATNGQGHK